jgi:hypothetical protein
VRAPLLSSLRPRPHTEDRLRRRRALVIRFPPRAIHTIVVCKNRDDGGWITLANGHGWVFGSLADAQLEARWLARNLNLPIAESSP